MKSMGKKIQQLELEQNSFKCMFFPFFSYFSPRLFITGYVTQKSDAL